MRASECAEEARRRGTVTVRRRSDDYVLAEMDYRMLEAGEVKTL
jgi:hypothetical protein